jgi:uncharacterized protein
VAGGLTQLEAPPRPEPEADAPALDVEGPPRARKGLPVGALAVVVTVAAIAALRLIGDPRVAKVQVAFVSLVMESLPFLLVGAAVAGVLHGRAGQRLMVEADRHPRLAYAIAPLTGLGLPLCDCGVVPLARTLRDRGTRAEVVNGFVAGAPLTNPIVILSTLVAFPGQPLMAAGRVVVGVAVALVIGALAPRPGPGTTPHGCDGGCERPARRGATLERIGQELAATGPWLVAGAGLAAVIRGVVPDGVFEAVADQPLLAAAAMMALAFVLSICSQADAFVAASLPVGRLAQLTFLVLGPMCDLKLSTLYRREFGGRWVAGYVAVAVPAVFALATIWMVWSSW